MGVNQGRFAFSDFRGGMNSTDHPLALGERQCAAAINVEYFRSTLGEKRAGTAALTTPAGMADVISRLFWHTASSANELWALENTDGWYRYASATWTTPTAVDSWAAKTGTDGVTLNNKLFLCDSSMNNLSVWDGTSVRRAGLPKPGSGPSVADQGSGTYAATLRYYKTCYAAQASSVTIRRGELSAATSFTPSGSGASARVTGPSTSTYYGDTHWELYASADNLVYYLLATTAIGSTYDDSTAVADYDQGADEPVVGDNALPYGCNYLCADGNRLVLAGYHDGTVTKSSRVTWTPVLGTSDVGDDERVPPANYKDVGQMDGEYITGIAKRPVWNRIYVFKPHYIYALVPTGNVVSPYAETLVSSSYGCSANRTIVVGADADGRDAIYFLSESGPCRITVYGVEYIGHNLEARWASWAGDTTHAVWYPYKRQVWFTNKQDSETWVYHVATGAWSVFTRPTALATGCSCGYPDANAVQHPHLGGTGAIYQGDSGTTDAGTAYQAYVTTPAVAAGGLVTRFSTVAPYLVAKAQAASVVSVTCASDFGAESRSATVSLTPLGVETRVIRKVMEVEAGDASVVQYTIGDSAASAVTWNLDSLTFPAAKQEPS